MSKVTRNYEIMLIVDGDLAPEAASAVLEKLSKLLVHAKDMNVTDMGKRDLAYHINKKSKGFYTVLNFNGIAEDIFEFERQAKLSPEVLRSLVINLESDKKERLNNKEAKIQKVRDVIGAKYVKAEVAEVATTEISSETK